MDLVNHLACTVAKLGLVIPNDVVACVVHGVLLVTVIIGMLTGISVIAYKGLKKLYRAYIENVQGIASLVSWIILEMGVLFYGNIIKNIAKINLWLLLSMVYGLYMLVYGVYQSRK